MSKKFINAEPIFTMSLRLKSLFYFAFLFLFCGVSGQEKISVGEKSRLFSSVLKEEREIFVHLPKSYQDSTVKPASYPVIYLLDGEMNFEFFAPMTDYFSKNPFATIPECIVVGIKNTDRTRNFTPTKASVKSPLNGKTLFENSGGAEDFIQFLEKELKPFVNKKYRTSSYSILAGHSFGGLLVIQSMISHPDYFNAYVAVDPSLWWDQEVMIGRTKNYLQTHQQRFPDNIVLYLAQADNEEKNKAWNQDMVAAIQKFNALVQDNNSLRYGYAFYKGEDHGTISYPAYYQALRFVFGGFKTDVKEVARHPELLMKSYEQFSEISKHQWLPSEPYLKVLMKFCVENNLPESHQYFSALKSKLYP